MQILNTEECPKCKMSFCNVCKDFEGEDMGDKDVRDRYMKRKANKKDTQKVVQDLLDSLNIMSSTSQKDVGNAFVSELNNTHRSLQQSFGDVVLRAIIEYGAWAVESGRYDARNEAFVKTCVKLKEAMDESHMPTI